MPIFSMRTKGAVLITWWSYDDEAKGKIRRADRSILSGQNKQWSTSIYLLLLGGHYALNRRRLRRQGRYLSRNRPRRKWESSHATRKIWNASVHPRRLPLAAPLMGGLHVITTTAEEDDGTGSTTNSIVDKSRLHDTTERRNSPNYLGTLLGMLNMATAPTASRDASPSLSLRMDLHDVHPYFRGVEGAFGPTSWKDEDHRERLKRVLRGIDDDTGGAGNGSDNSGRIICNMLAIANVCFRQGKRGFGWIDSIRMIMRKMIDEPLIYGMALHQKVHLPLHLHPSRLPYILIQSRPMCFHCEKDQN
eukprot:scaffold130643_cov36-Cyclotella_meneghiniana.AAC.1